MSVSIGELTGEVSLEDKFSEAFDVLLRSVEEGAKEIESAFGAVTLGVGLAAAAVVGLTAAVIEMAVKGSELKDIHEGFDRLAGSAQNADDILAAMRKGVIGTIDDISLMQIANKALATGAAKTAEQFGTMTSAARVLSREGFGPVTQQINTIERALATGRTRQLQYMVGVIDLKKAEEDYAASIGHAGEKLTAQGKLHADQIAIFEKLNSKVKEAGEQQLSFAEKVKAAEIAVTNWTHDLLMAVGASPAVNKAFDDIGAAILRAFGGSAKTAQEAVLAFVEKFAAAVGHYGPIAIDWMRAVYDKVIDIWHAVQAAWDTVPDWFKNIAREAVLTAAAIGGINVVTKSLTGGDILSNLASVAQIWSVLPNLFVKIEETAPQVARSMGAIYDSLVLFFTVARGIEPAGGGIIGYFTNLGTAVGALSGLVMSSPLFVAATWAVVGYGAFKAGEAFGGMYNAWKESGSMWAYFGKGGGFWDESIVGRWLGMSEGARITTEQFRALRIEAELLAKPLNDLSDKYRALEARDVAEGTKKGTQAFKDAKTAADALAGALPDNIKRMENLNTVLTQMRDAHMITPNVFTEAAKDVKALNIDAEKLPVFLRQILEASKGLGEGKTGGTDGDVAAANSKKIEDATAASLTRTEQLWDQYYQLLAKEAGNTMEAQLKGFDRTFAGQEKVLLKSKQLNKNYYEELYAMVVHYQEQYTEAMTVALRKIENVTTGVISESALSAFKGDDAALAGIRAGISAILAARRENDGLIAKASLDATEYQILLINREVDEKQRALLMELGLTKQYYDAVDALSAGRILKLNATGAVGEGTPDNITNVVSAADYEMQHRMIDPGKKAANAWLKGFSSGIADFPKLLISALTGGGGIGGAFQALGANITDKLFGEGGTLSKVTAGISGKLGGLLGKGLGKTLGDAIGGSIAGLLPGIGGLVAPLIGKLVNLFKSIGGPSKTELAGRDVVATFEKQFSGTVDMINKVGAAYETIGKSREDAQAAIKAAWDAERQGAEATTEAVNKLNEALKRASEIDAAIGNLGVKSHDELMHAADIANAAYEKIAAGVAAGQYTAEQATTAYRAYQQALADAGDAAAKAWLETQNAVVTGSKAIDAAMQKLVDRRDALTQSISQEAPEAERGTIEKQMRAERDAIQTQIDDATKAQDAAANAAEEAARSADKSWRDHANEWNNDIHAQSQETADAMQNDFVNAAQNAANGVQDAFTGIEIRIPILFDLQQVSLPSGKPEASGEVGYASGPMTFSTQGNEFFAFGGEGQGVQGLTSKVGSGKSGPMTVQVFVGSKQVKEVLIDELEAAPTSRDVRVLRGLR